MAPVLRRLQNDTRCQSIVCVSGQHRQLLDQVLQQFSITPDIDLDIMSTSQDLFDVTSRVLLKLRAVLQSVQPDRVIVQGDTTTSFAASLAAFYLGIPVAHVEAGLRTTDPRLPFPEEQNRRLISRIADLHFAPTLSAKENLLREGVLESTIFVTGNTVIDALRWMTQQRERQADNEVAPMILMTGHRRENFGVGFSAVFSAIRCLALAHPEWRIVYPLHLNPNVKGPAETILGGLSNVDLISPLQYCDFIALMQRVKIVITDSGGVQEEAPALGKPVLLTRSLTGRPEGVAEGAVMLVGCDRDRIIQEVERLMSNEAHYQSMSKVRNLFGDGQAAEKIVEIITSKHEVVCV